MSADEWADYDSGPFCRHWYTPGDCGIVCARCGHGCTDHGAEDGLWGCTECDCPEWQEPEDKATAASPKANTRPRRTRKSEA